MAKKNKNFRLWEPWPKIAKVIFQKRVKFSWGQCSCDIPTAFQGNFSSSEHCMNVFVCFNLLLVCARNLATEKWKKNILRKGSSTEDIGIITLARGPSGTAEADIVTLLHDFFDNSQTAEVRFTSKVLRETFFHCAYFEILATPLWRHWQTQSGEKLKSWVNYSSGYVQKPVEKSTNTLEKFIRHRSVGRTQSV